MCASAPPTWTSSCGRSPTAASPRRTPPWLAAMNIADQYFREQDAAENLRRQIKDNLEEVNQLKMELSEAKREIFKLQNRK